MARLGFESQERDPKPILILYFSAFTYQIHFSSHSSLHAVDTMAGRNLAREQMCGWGEWVVNAFTFSSTGALAKTRTYSKVKNMFYLEVSIRSRFLGPQSKMAPFCDRAGELQLGGCFPTDYFFHSVLANQPNDFNGPVQKSKESNALT